MDLLRQKVSEGAGEILIPKPKDVTIRITRVDVLPDKGNLLELTLCLRFHIGSLIIFMCRNCKTFKVLIVRE